MAASCNINGEAFAPIDRWSRLELHELVAEARQAFADGRIDEAQSIANVGLTRFPEATPLLIVLGWVQAQRAELAAAEATFRHSLSRDGESADAQAGLAAVLAASGRHTAAVPHYQRALGRCADDAQTQYNFGCTLLALYRFDEAIDAFDRTVRLAPHFAAAFHNLAIAHAQLGHWEVARDNCDRALAVDPTARHVRVMRGMCCVALGAFADGWDDYEARCQLQGDVGRQFGLPAWQGPADGRQSIAVVPEQGVGTQVLMASCVAELSRHVSEVTIGCEPRLVGVLRRSFPGVHVVVAGLLPTLARCGLFDCYVMAGSLPRFFRRTAESFPGSPYLSAELRTRSSWKERLARLGSELKVGVAWGGGGRKGDTIHRCTKPSDWRPLAALANLQWINLQYDATPAERDVWKRMAGNRFHDWHDIDKKHDLEGLAALVKELDLVITVVNSLVHIAGALAIPTWALIPAGGEWRWQARGETCLWHSSVRLIRQERLGDWSSVFARLSSELSVQADASRHIGRRGAAA